MRVGVVGNRGYPELASFLDRLQHAAPSTDVVLAFEPALHELVPRAERMDADTPIEAQPPRISSIATSGAS